MGVQTAGSIAGLTTVTFNPDGTKRELKRIINKRDWNYFGTHSIDKSRQVVRQHRHCCMWVPLFSGI
jgi:hypothetical protein